MAADLSTERMEAKEKLNDAFTILKENNFQDTAVYSVPIFFNDEAEVETSQIFYLLQYIKVFVIYSLTVKEILECILGKIKVIPEGNGKILVEMKSKENCTLLG